MIFCARGAIVLTEPTVVLATVFSTLPYFFPSQFIPPILRTIFVFRTEKKTSRSVFLFFLKVILVYQEP